MRRSRLPTKALKAWADLNGVQLNGVTIQDLQNGQGAGLVANQNVTEANSVFVRVPKELILSKDLVWEYSLSDPALRAVLEAMGDWAKETPQGSITLFLLIQMTATSPDVGDRIGLPNPFTEYTQFLPDERGIPSRWSEDELACLWGTSLRNHMAVKLQSLEALFDLLRQNTQTIPWCAKWWWHEETGVLTLEDFKEVDSMFRSRAMDFGDKGQSLVPVMDMANHDHADNSVALYEFDRVKGSALLILQEDRYVSPGFEVTINYGSDRSASDLLHAYGFMDNMKHAGSMFVSFPEVFPPFESDPLAIAKHVGLELVKGVKFYALPDGRVKFHSPFVYAMAVNEEDGLSWDLARTLHGETELHFFFQGVAVDNADMLLQRLQDHPLWNLFQWRAHAYLSILVDGLLSDIRALQQRPMAEKMPDGVTNHSHAWKMAETLRALELRLLEMVSEDFRLRLDHLERSDTVVLWSRGELGADGTMDAEKTNGTPSYEEGNHPEEGSDVGNGADFAPTEEQTIAAEENWKPNDDIVAVVPPLPTRIDNLSTTKKSVQAEVERAIVNLSIAEGTKEDSYSPTLARSDSYVPPQASKANSLDSMRQLNSAGESQPQVPDDEISEQKSPSLPYTPSGRARSFLPCSLDGNMSPAKKPSVLKTTLLEKKSLDFGPVEYLGRMRFDRAGVYHLEHSRLTAETHHALESASQRLTDGARQIQDASEDDFS